MKKFIEMDRMTANSSISSHIDVDDETFIEDDQLPESDTTSIFVFK